MADKGKRKAPTPQPPSTSKKAKAIETAKLTTAELVFETRKKFADEAKKSLKV
jgi:hypothetical protein